MKHAKFEKVMSRAGELATLPTVAQRAIEVIQDPRSSAHALREIIELDPVIAGKLLRLANSAYYRMAGAEEVGNVHSAIVVLGFSSIRNIVLATCLNSLYGQEFKTQHFSARDLWSHSVTAAVACRVIARRISPDSADEAFMAGLLHDVGMIVEWNLFPDLFPQVLARYQGTGAAFTKVEHETLGFDHCAVGAHILRSWRLPKTIRDAVAHHHDPEASHDADGSLQVITQLAEKICAARGDGFFDSAPQATAESLAEAFESVGLERDAYPKLASQLDEDLHQANDMLDL